MLFQVENTPSGYIVSVYYEYHWYPLRNFGDRQGDAKFFKDFDCPKLEVDMVRLLVTRFNSSVKYSRGSSGRFFKHI